MRQLQALRAQANRLNGISYAETVLWDPASEVRGVSGLAGGFAGAGIAGAGAGAGSSPASTSLDAAAPGVGAGLRCEGVFAPRIFEPSGLERPAPLVPVTSLPSAGGAPAEASRTGKPGFSLLGGWGRKGKEADSSASAGSASPGGASGKPSGSRLPYDDL